MKNIYYAHRITTRLYWEKHGNAWDQYLNADKIYIDKPWKGMTLLMETVGMCL